VRFPFLIAPALLAAGCLSAHRRGGLLFEETFSQGMDRWWVEGGEKVWVEDGHLHMKADPPQVGPGYVCTAWCKETFPADVRIEFDAHVVDSEIDANNINFFFCYSDPTGTPLFETRQTRDDAGYKKYHGLNGHIITFLNDFKGTGGPNADGSAKARVRMRRCPGFDLMIETYAGHCRKGVTYRCTITKTGGKIAFAVDGNTVLEAVDPAPLEGGLLGLRTFRTHLWWDNIRVFSNE
jgi:hypothetical protein